MTAPLGPVEQGVIICNDALFQCRCVLSKGHESSVHRCDPGCGGSWEWLSDHEFRPCSYPSGGMTGRAAVRVSRTAEGIPFQEVR